MAEGTLKLYNSVFENESARQTTFFAYNWPINAPVWPILLVRSGFYYQGKNQDVTCFCCGLTTSVKDWTRNVHPQQMHFKLNPDCQFIQFLLKPEGGSQTFNDRGKWQIQSQNTDTTEEKNNIQHVQEDIEKINRNESIAQKVEEISTLNILKDKLDCNINISSNTPFGNIENNAIPEILPSMVQQSVVSQDSGFATSRTESSIYTDSAPPGSMSTECLLISGSTPYPYRSSQSHGNSYLPGSFLTTNSRAVSDGTASIQSSFASADIQSAIARPEHLNYKHPEMETVTDRIDTFVTWPHKDIQDPRIVATAGFYYTMDHDIVRCFCCDLGLSEWDENDSPWTEHARHSPNCWYLKRVKGQNFIDDIQKDWKKIYNPKFPNLIDEGDRIKTFSNWPNIVVRPTSIDIAKAGFFYTGRGDECRCHYCDGGLQHWESGDNPWEQHAYYFPFCKFVIKMKGRDFISQIRERFVASSPNVDALMRESEEAEAAQTRDDIRERKIKDILGKQEFKDIVNFGYSKKSIKLAAEEVFKDTGDFKFTPQHVLNKILDIQDRDDSLPVDDDDEDETEETEEAKHKSLLTADEFMKELEKEQPVEDAEKVVQENKKLKQKMICWKCCKKEICMLFTPCGHRLTCEDCARSIHNCLKCNKKVKKRIKTFLA